MKATIKTANPRRIIRTKTLYTRGNALNSGEKTRPHAETDPNDFAEPKNLYITTVKQASSAAC
jgi:hypothetical protein